jgi:hypothetical protein
MVRRGVDSTIQNHPPIVSEHQHLTFPAPEIPAKYLLYSRADNNINSCEEQKNPSLLRRGVKPSEVSRRITTNPSSPTRSS